MSRPAGGCPPSFRYAAESAGAATSRFRARSSPLCVERRATASSRTATSAGSWSIGSPDRACRRPRERAWWPPLALGPGRRSKFFDPKARVTPRPIEVWRGKSGHRRAGCCPSRKARAGAAGQAAATESVTENKPPGGPLGGRQARVKRWGKSPPRPPRGGRHEKPLPVQDKIGDWTARPIVSGMSHPSAAERLRRAEGGRAGPKGRERNDGRSAERRRTESGLPAPKLSPY